MAPGTEGAGMMTTARSVPDGISLDRFDGRNAEDRFSLGVDGDDRTAETRVQDVLEDLESQLLRLRGGADDGEAVGAKKRLQGVTHVAPPSSCRKSISASRETTGGRGLLCVHVAKKESRIGHELRVSEDTRGRPRCLDRVSTSAAQRDRLEDARRDPEPRWTPALPTPECASSSSPARWRSTSRPGRTCASCEAMGPEEMREWVETCSLDRPPDA